MGPLSNFLRKATGASASAGGSPGIGAGAAVVATPAPPLAPPAASSGAADSIVFRPARREEISVALRLVLGSHGRAADDGQVVDFMQFALRRGISLADLWLAERAADHTLAWAVLPVVSPGRTLLLLGPSDPPHRRSHDAVPVAQMLVERVCDHFAGRGVQLAQVLLDPGDLISRGLYEARGFGRVAELLYLQAEPRRTAAAPALPPNFHWVAYGPETHDVFVAAIARTYQESLDCPALNGLRDMDDVLAGHKASGQFHPDLWLMLCEDAPGAGGGNGAVAPVARGVLLLSVMQPGELLELVYLGLTPDARGRGLGDLLVKQALATVAAHGAGRLSLAVDSDNAPALKLYYRHGLRRVASKLALMRVLRPGAGAADSGPADSGPADSGTADSGSESHAPASGSSLHESRPSADLSTGASHVR